MDDIFSGASKADPDVSKRDTSEATDMGVMFAGAGSANPDVSKRDVSKVTDVAGMFRESGIKKLDLGKWKLNSQLLSNPQDARYMLEKRTDCRRKIYVFLILQSGQEKTHIYLILIVLMRRFLML